MNQFIFDIRPLPKVRQVHSDVWRKRPAVIRARANADELRILAKFNKYSFPLAFSIEFIFEMPMSWSKKKQTEMNGVYHQSTPDIDNIYKQFTDALYDKDEMIFDVSMSKKWGRSNQIIVTPY